MPVAVQPASEGPSIVLLGTAGGPIARADRAGIATLLTIGGKRYLVDASKGVAHQLVQGRACCRCQRENAGAFHIGVVNVADLAVIRSIHPGKLVVGSDQARLTF